MRRLFDAIDPVAPLALVNSLRAQLDEQVCDTLRAALSPADAVADEQTFEQCSARM